MARIDKGLVTLVGRDRENPRTHRDAFQITGGLGEMLDEHIKRNNLNKSEFIREAIAAKLEAEMPKEPLIKDEKVRKAVRAWAEVNGVGGCICKDEIHCITFETERGMFISFESADPIPPEGNYTIAELCGENDE